MAFDGRLLTVATNSGETERVAVPPDVGVTAIIPASLAAVVPGVTVGIVGFGPPDHQRAAVVSIFPAGRSVNEAQFPWDSAPESTMTNAPVTAAVAATEGRTLSLSFKGHTITVDVPPNAVVQSSEPGTPALLVPGAHVLIFAQRSADGALSAPRVNVGKDGFVPAN